MLDSAHRLLWVGGDWDDFALRNQGNLARSAKVLGTRLEEHFVGAETQELIESILTDVRETKRSFRVEYRCDSPIQRRDMRMTVATMQADRLLVIHDLLDAQSFPAIGPGWQWQAGALDRKCSFCCALWQSEAWVDPFETGQRHPEVVDYVICPQCRERVDRERSRIRKAGRLTL